MARPYVRSIQPYESREIFGNLSQSNHYQVSFSGLKPNIIQHISRKYGVNNANDFISRKGGILCSQASLPTSNLATYNVKDNFMGIPQEFAHTRVYDDIEFTFYVDKDYKNLRILEGWMDYISSGSESPSFDGMNELDENYYRRMRYPEDYKVQSMFISKFEKDYTTQLDYQFVNAFPTLISSIPVSYGNADILKVSVTFNYDRYIINPKGSIAQRQNENKITGVENNQRASEKEESLRPSPQPITVTPYTQPIQSDFGNTYGARTPFVERDPATGVRMDGVPEPEPITYRQELGLDPL